MTSSSATRSTFANSSAEHVVDVDRITPAPSVWSGFLHEFRNHLTVLMAAASELRDLPPALALRLGDSVLETERNIQGLTALVAIVDASVNAPMRAREPLIAPLGDVIDRAVALATPCVAPRASIVARVPRETGVRNSGSALEALVAALVVDLAKSHVGADAGSAPRVRIDSEVGRRGLAIEIGCAGARLDPASWRLGLANDLTAQLGATLTVAAEDFAYVVQFR
jgi:hypothetical protein